MRKSGYTRESFLQELGLSASCSTDIIQTPIGPNWNVKLTEQNVIALLSIPILNFNNRETTQAEQQLLEITLV